MLCSSISVDVPRKPRRSNVNVIKRRARSVLFFLTIMAVPLGLVAAAPAASAGSPIAYTQSGNHYTGLRGLPSYAPGVTTIAWLSPGEPFYMVCWVSNPNGGTGGNYPTYKWFWGQSKNHGNGYLNASVVYYQITVPHC